MKLLIVYNSVKNQALSTAKETEILLNSVGAQTKLIDFEQFSLENENNTDYYSTFDVVVAVGGDGTIIKVAKNAAYHNKPIIGINAGRLGYLASIDSEHLDKIINIVSGDFEVENRVMLTAQKCKNGVCTDACDCLNDIVISKSSVATMLDIELKVRNDLINYRADGLICATPTGSTAYSLSAGGPVVDPSVDCMLLTAVCPHTLMNRSVVVSGDTAVSVKVSNADNMKIFLSCDGKAAFEVDDNSVVKIMKSKNYAKFIKLNDISVFKVFSEKTKLN